MPRLFPKTRLAVSAALFGTLLSASVPVSAASLEPMLGSIDFVGFNFAPRGWASCDGQLLPISSNSALFSLLGTTYGGDGRTTFALPDLRGRVPMHKGQGPGLSNYAIGQRGGQEAHTLSVTEIPAHTHAATTTVDPSGLKMRGNDGAAATPEPGANALASTGRNNTYAAVAPNVDMAPGSVGGTASAATVIGSAGGGQAFPSMPPYLVLNCIIALQGVYPSRD